MTNNEFQTALAPRVKKLADLRQEAISIARGIIGESLFKEDLYFCSALDRCMSLIDGFIPMLEFRNLSCVGALLRVQMDNCMRTYAAFIAKGKQAVIDCIISGERIDKQVDVNGKQLRDGHLKHELSKIDPKFEQVYNRASGFIHLSSAAFYQTVVGLDDYKIEFQVGRELPEDKNPVLLEGADAFIHFVKLHFKMLYAVVESKQRADAAMEEKDRLDADK